MGIKKDTMMIPAPRLRIAWIVELQTTRMRKVIYGTLEPSDLLVEETVMVVPA